LYKVPLYFSLSDNTLYSSDGGLEVRIYLMTHHGSAKQISLPTIATALEQRVEDGLRGISPTLLFCFANMDFSALDGGFKFTCPFRGSFDLAALAASFPALAERNWLPAHFHPEHRPPKFGELGYFSLVSDHFYDDSESWGYHIFLSFWLADDIGSGPKAPSRLLFISPNETHDFGDLKAEKPHDVQELEKARGKVFISYVRDDATEVARLVKDLEAHGITTWRDWNDILPGQNWRDAIREAIRSGAAFIACFSSNYARRDKTYMNEELQLAIAEIRLMPKNRVWFIPVLLNPCAVPDYEVGPGRWLSDFQRVPLFENWHSSLKNIVTAVERVYASKQGR
jgi:hypothetical protein